MVKMRRRSDFVEQRTDDELIQQTLSGESAAFGELVQRYQDAVYATALHRIKDFAAAQDVAQEAFIAAYRSLHTLREPGRFPSWLYTITLRQCNRWQRRHRELTPLDDLEEPQQRTVRPDEELERKELRRIVLDAIAALPENAGEVVTMYYIDGLSYNEIASFLFVPTSTVKGRLQMGRRQLKEELITMVEDSLKQNRPDREFTEKVLAEVVRETSLPDVKPFNIGKVRDIYDLDDRLLIVATDRLSVFDVVLPTGIPYKGEILTVLSAFWFGFTENIIDNHLVTADVNEFPAELQKYGDILAGRSMIVKRAQRIDIECVARAYLAGSAWRAYREKGSICGIKLPPGLKESDKLPEPIFTPTTKAESGHDTEMTQSEVEDMVGSDVARKIKEKSLQLLAAASSEVESKGLILSDTKFEFGFYDGAIILIDEVFTPDSSRFWPMDDYEPGRSQRSFDKQYVRDYLDGQDWDKTPPGPHLPDDVVRRTTQRYFEAYRIITGKQGL